MYVFLLFFLFFFFFNDTATTEIYTLSLHDALPISRRAPACGCPSAPRRERSGGRSEEHTSELQSRGHLVCRLLLEKKKQKHYRHLLSNTKKNMQTKSQHPTAT